MSGSPLPGSLVLRVGDRLFMLRPLAASVFRMVDGRTTPDRIAAFLGLELSTVAAVLGDLHAAQLVIEVTPGTPAMPDAFEGIEVGA